MSIVMSSVQAFISVMDEFLMELQKTFPEEKKIAVYYNSFKTMRKTNPRVILEGFMAEASKRADKITQRDESYFLSGDDEFMNELLGEIYIKGDIDYEEAYDMSDIHDDDNDPNSDE